MLDDNDEFDASIQNKILRRINELQTENYRTSADLSTTFPINEETYSPEVSPQKQTRSQSKKLSIGMSKTPKAGNKFGSISSFSVEAWNGDKTPSRMSNEPSTPSSIMQVKSLSFVGGHSEDQGNPTTPSTKASRTSINKASLKNMSFTTKASAVNKASAPYFMSAKAVQSRTKPTTPKGLSTTSNTALRAGTNLLGSQSKFERSFQRKSTMPSLGLNKSTIMGNTSFEKSSKNALNSSAFLAKKSDARSITPKSSLKRNNTLANISFSGNNTVISKQNVSKNLASKSQSKQKLLSIVSSTLQPQKVKKRGTQKEKSQELVGQSTSELERHVVHEAVEKCFDDDDNELASQRARQEKLLQNEIKKRILREKLRDSAENESMMI